LHIFDVNIYRSKGYSGTGKVYAETAAPLWERHLMEEDKPKSRHQTTTLSFRIIIRLVLPLFILSAIFAGLLLSNQINYMNHFNKIEGQMAFSALRQTVQEAYQESVEQGLDFPEIVRSRLKPLASQYAFGPVQIIDLINKRLLYGTAKPPLTAADYKMAEESLYALAKESKPFQVRINREEQAIIAYIPLQDSEGKTAFVTRASFPLANFRNALSKSKMNLVLILFFISLTGISIGKALADSIVKPIRKLNEMTQLIMQGELGKHVRIETHDEIETLARTFNKMSDRLIDMKRQAEDSNPLTQLPGNQGIFRELQKRISERQKFVLFHVDLDRFKIFNDHFGLARGDEVIKKTAALLKDAVRVKGAAGDFVGHQGGDDFLVITRPNHAKDLAEYVCQHFDSEVLTTLYRREDIEHGYIMEVDRRKFNETGEEVLAKFPLMAISLAGVSNAKRDFADYFECMATAVGVKKEVKKTVTSSYLIKE
jgi:diguanylate cyclase (GGDEF)-like protein